MSKDDMITTPLINIIQTDKEKSDEYVKDMMSLMMARGNLSSVQYHKHKLGKQSYCRTFWVKHWIWDFGDWVVYVSKRGVAFEVPEYFTVDQAWSAWKDYHQRMI